MPLNIAEGNAKAGAADRRRYFQIARGSALECAAIQDVLRAGDALDQSEHEIRKKHLDHISTMLTKPTRKLTIKVGGCSAPVRETSSVFPFSFVPLSAYT